METHGFISLCRICLVNGAEIPIFETENTEDPNVNSKLTQCLGEKIEDIEGYPRNICKLCHITLNTVTKFIKQYQDSCKILQQGLQMVVKQETVQLSDFSSNEQSELDIDIECIKLEPKLEFDNADQFLELTKPLKLKLNNKLKKETKNKKINSNNNILSKNNTNKIASSILEGIFVWTGEKWCTKSSPPPLDVKKHIPQPITPKQPKQRALKPLKLNKPREPSLCDLCGQTFKNKDKLNTHKKTTHFKEKVKCPTCFKVCSSAYYLNRHIRRTHSDSEKKFVCSACGKQFAFKGELSAHYRKVHEKEQTKKIYKCKLCDKLYACNKSVVIHERSVHTGERPAICSVCGSSFYHEDYLKEHMRLHTGETPFKCPICARGYAQRGNMKSHIRHVHRLSQMDEVTLSTLKPCYRRLLRV